MSDEQTTYCFRCGGRYPSRLVSAAVNPRAGGDEGICAGCDRGAVLGEDARLEIVAIRKVKYQTKERPDAR